MADLLLEPCDKFTIMYDMLAFLKEDATSKYEIASSMRLSAKAIQQLLSFMLDQGFVRMAGSNYEFKITTLGSAFLADFYGMRKFLF